LPDGYLPITRAAGLGNLVDYTTTAAAAVLAQGGVVPSVTGAAPSATGSSAAPQTGASGGAGGQTGTGPTLGSGTGAAAGPAPAAGNAANPTGVAGGPSIRASVSVGPAKIIATRPAGATRSLSPGVLGSLVPILALLGLLSAFASVWISGVGRR
jgi:hypothetical protein